MRTSFSRPSCIIYTGMEIRWDMKYRGQIRDRKARAQLTNVGARRRGFISVPAGDYYYFFFQFRRFLSVRHREGIEVFIRGQLGSFGF